MWFRRSTGTSMRSCSIRMCSQHALIMQLMMGKRSHLRWLDDRLGVRKQKEFADEVSLWIPKNPLSPVLIVADEDTIKEHARPRRLSHCKQANNPLRIVRFWFMYYWCASVLAELLSWTCDNVSTQGYWFAMYIRYCLPIIVCNTVQPHASQSDQHRMSFTLLWISKALNKKNAGIVVCRKDVFV